jgi:hypothetical protein
MAWEIDSDLVQEWLLNLDEGTYIQVRAALGRLAELGPHLGRPLVDSIEGSKHSNMKELRPGSSGRSEIRILFAFDPRRHAILLIAGDKSHQWKKWYKINIPLADDLFDQHLEKLENEKQGGNYGKNLG